MEILKSMVYLDEGAGMLLCDTIEYDGTMWLVPHWVVFLDEGVRKPSRLVRLDRLAHQPSSMAGVTYSVNEPLPKGLFQTAKPAQIPARFVVIEAPDLAVPVPK